MTMVYRKGMVERKRFYRVPFGAFVYGMVPVDASLMKIGRKQLFIGFSGPGAAKVYTVSDTSTRVAVMPPGMYGGEEITSFDFDIGVPISDESGLNTIGDESGLNTIGKES